jgi:hypothetical protein
MKNYSIEKIGSDYVVKVDDLQVMKVGSRRRAAKLVVDASELLDEAPLVPVQGTATSRPDAETAIPAADDEPGAGCNVGPSITRDSPEVA